MTPPPKLKPNMIEVVTPFAKTQLAAAKRSQANKQSISETCLLHLVSWQGKPLDGMLEHLETHLDSFPAS